MLKFIICDDETASLSLMETLVRTWSAERKCEAKITLCRNAEQFLFLWEDKKDADIIILDIDMPGMNGIRLARRLREEGGAAQIIFATGLAEYALEGYDVEAVSYLIKPVDNARFFACLNKAKERSLKEEPVLVLRTAEGMARIKLADICYLESDAHDTQVHCVSAAGAEDVQTGRTGIREMEARLAELSGGFFRIHRSYVVNLAYVSRISKRQVRMDTGEVLPVSRNRWEALNLAYLAYYAEC